MLSIIESTISIIGKCFIWFLQCYAILYFLPVARALSGNKLNHLVCYAISTSAIIVVHFLDKQLYFQFIVVFLFCGIFLLVNFVYSQSRVAAVLSENNYKIFKCRYITNLMLYMLITTIWSYPFLFYFLFTGLLSSFYVNKYYHKIACHTLKQLIMRSLQYVIINTIISQKVLSILISIHLFFFDQYSTTYFLFDFCLFIIFLTLDEHIYNKVIIRLSIKHNLHVKGRDIKKLVIEWSSSETPELEARYILYLLSHNKLNRETLEYIINLGSNQSKLVTRSFISIFSIYLRIANSNSDAPTKASIHKILNKYQKDLENLNIVEIVNLSNITNEYNELIFRLSMKHFENLAIDINERIYVSNALLKQIGFNPLCSTMAIGSRTVDSLKRIALKNKSKILNHKELLISLISLQCLKPRMTELTYDFFETYYLINIRSYLSLSPVNDIRLPTIKAEALSKLDKYFASHSLTSNERFSLVETISVILYHGFSIDTTIFTEFHPKDWHKELLTYVLLGKAIKVNIKGYNEPKVKEFIEQINSLKNLMKYHGSHANAKTEKVLKCLINKQNQFNFNLSQIVNLVIVSQAHIAQLDVLLSGEQQTFIEDLINMEFLWLKKICDAQNFLIDHKNGDLYRLHTVLADYDVSVLQGVFMKINNETCLSDIISFFQILNKSPLSSFSKHIVLKDLTKDSVHIWKIRLCEKIARLLLSTEFPNYKNIEYKQTKVAKQTQTVLKKIKKKFSTLLPGLNNKNHNEEDVINVRQTQLNYALQRHTTNSRELNAKFLELENKLAMLLRVDSWPIKSIVTLIKCVDSLQKIEELLQSLEIILEYNLKEDKVLSDLLHRPYNNKNILKVLQFAIKKRFSGTYEKNTEILLNEVKYLNKHKNVNFMEGQTLEDAYHAVINCYFEKSNIFESNKCIGQWSSDEVSRWANYLKTQHIPVNVVSQHEKIAVLIKAMELSSNFVPRSIQIMSVLLMVNPAQGKGRLAQINTGEGKTAIIAIIAAYHALHYHQVDIVTTSPILAIPQSEQQRQFYSMLNLSVAHNFQNPSGYLADVCYGPALDFQADVLRDECHEKNTRKGRKFDVVIVDEVDSMFIDGNSHIVKLSRDMPGMNNLETILAAIAIQINSVAGCVQTIDGKGYYLQTENRINCDGTVNSGKVDYIPLNCSIEKFVKDATESHIRKLVRDTKEVEESYPIIDIPNHLRDFVCKVQIPKWIDSAIRAKYRYENMKHYIVRKGKIMPVDTQNTGIVQENQHWGCGLHQFLQIKHGTTAKLYPESLTSNFISNIGFFKRYGENIYGLTGTLGEEKSCTFLEKVYEVDTIIIPPFKQKQHFDLSSNISNTKNEWYSNIVKNSIAKLNCGRAVLIITKYIKEIDLLFELFCDNKYNKSKVILFKTNEDAGAINKEIKPGEVILTTNIAGRGTDIKLASSINDSGGLHVCLTFLPVNTRVEAQNFGRTSRMGNRGTSQLMIYDKGEVEIKCIKGKRDKNQETIITEAEKQSEIVITKEFLFSQFLKLRESIKGREGCRANELVAIEERFAIWLKLNELFIDTAARTDVFQGFEKFKITVIEDDQKAKLIQNPYFHVCIGKQLMERKQFKNAIQELTMAINLDNNFAEHAFYNRGYCLLALYGNNMSRHKWYIDDSISDFKLARKNIRKRETDLHLIQRASDAEVFSEQVQHKINLYNIQKQAIDLAIGPDRDEIEEQIISLNKRLQSIPTEKKDDIKEIKELIETMQTNKKQKGVIEEALEKGRNVSVEPMNIADCLPDEEMGSYVDEIEEFNRNGFIGGFKVTEIKPIDWKAVFALLVLGFGQLIAGAALAVYTLGAGATLAINLISEGINDIITAVKDGIINREFSWATWAIQKAISIVVSVICAGMSAVKDVANTACSGAKMLGKKVIDQTVKSGWKIVAKKVGTELAKGIAKEIVIDLANYGLEVTLIPKIQERLVQIIEKPIQDALKSNRFIEAMLKMDVSKNNNDYEKYILATALQILQTTCKSPLLNFAKQIALGVADGKIKYCATGRKIAEAIMAINELELFVPKFIDKLNNSIESKANKDKIMNIQNDQNTSSIDETNQNKTKNIATHLDPSISDSEDDIDLLKDKEEQTHPVKTKTKNRKDTSRLSTKLVNSVSNNMLSIIKGKIINPVMQAGVAYSMESITSGLTATLNKDIENYRSLKRVIHDQNKGFIKKSHVDHIHSSTITENKKADSLIEDARSGKKCGLPHLGAISDVTGRPIEVYDEMGRLKFTIGDKKSGKPLQIQHHKNAEHYTILGNRDTFAQGQGANMCLFNVISDQTGIDPDALKSKTLDWMECNKAEISKQSNDITRLEMYDGLKLCLGGAMYDGKDQSDAARYLDESNNTRGHKVGKASHNRGHASNPGATGLHDSVENFSKTDLINGKSGFKSYADQDYVAHYALQHQKAKDAMNVLNKADGTWDSYRQVVHLNSVELNLPMPKMAGKWMDGSQVGTDWAVKDIVMVIQHRQSEYGNDQAPVHILTIYPK